MDVGKSSAKSTSYWQIARTAGTVACYLGLLTLVAWYVPHHSLQNCRHDPMSDCSITEDNPINQMWGWIFIISLIGAIGSASVMLVNALFARVKGVSIEKAMALFGVSSLATILVCAFLPRWINKTFPGNTINWRHDHAMSAIWWSVWMASVVLFIMSLTATITCLFLVYRVKINRPKRSTVLKVTWWLVVLLIIWATLAIRNTY